MRHAAATIGLWTACAVAMAGWLPGCGPQAPASRVGVPATAQEPAMSVKIVKTDAQWRACLTPEQYHVTREKGTEPAFSGAYWKTKTPGTYRCVCCGQALFASDAKFASGTGWPSFAAPIAPGAVATRADTSGGMSRTEVLCSRCDGHLGHVFKDDRPASGLRYCINSASLKLVESK